MDKLKGLGNGILGYFVSYHKLYKLYQVLYGSLSHKSHGEWNINIPYIVLQLLCMNAVSLEILICILSKKRDINLNHWEALFNFFQSVSLSKIFLCTSSHDVL